MCKEGLVTAIIVAAGKGRRMGKAYNKQYIQLGDKPILAYTLAVFEEAKTIDRIILVVARDEISYVRDKIIKKYNFKKTVKVVGGGKERQDSVYAGLQELGKECEIVLIHDGARPFVDEKIIEGSIDLARDSGAAIVAVPPKDTIKIANQEGEVIKSLDRSKLWAVQTPQTFRYPLLKRAYRHARERGLLATDDSMLVEELGHRVKILEGDYENIKITTPEDLILGEGILEKRRNG